MRIEAALVLAGLIALPVGRASAQPAYGASPISGACVRHAGAGSPAERTLLIAASHASVQIPMQRPLSPATLKAMQDILPDSLTSRCGEKRLHLQTSVWFNASSAHPDRDGAVWQGRGFTVAATGGATVARGRFSGALAPIVVFTENRDFLPRPLPPLAAGDYRDPAWGTEIDLPYRFGSQPRAWIDGGESFARADAGAFGAGVSTATQVWGPAQFYPLVRSAEGPGYPRMFAEVRRQNVGIGSFSAEWHVGTMEPSAYRTPDSVSAGRVATAFTASFSPQWFPGLQVGGARFFHVRRVPGVWSVSTLTLPFGGLLKSQSADSVVGGYNQLASAFVSIAPPGTGLHVYGEYYREDHNADLRDLVAEPDHLSAFSLGVQKSWQNTAGYSAMTFERLVARNSHLKRLRPQGAVYTHSSQRDGHTHRGQALGSLAALGGQGLTVSFDRVEARRAFGAGVEIRSTAQNTEGGSWNGESNGVISLRLQAAHIRAGGAFGAHAAFGTGYGRERSFLNLGFSFSP